MRSIDTRFWSDTWVRRLNALDRYAFLYFLTNEHSSWCGVYEVDIAMVAFETGIDEYDLKKAILPRLSPKIIYVDGWVYIRNFEKYHSNHSEKTQKGIQAAWDKVPEKIRLRIRGFPRKKIPHRRGIGGVSASASASASASKDNAEPDGSAGSTPLKEKDWSFQTWIDSLKASPRKYIRIVALFFVEKPVTFENALQARAGLSRHVRAAKNLEGFTGEQIKNAMAVAREKHSDVGWTLETVVKILTK